MVMLSATRVCAVPIKGRDMVLRSTHSALKHQATRIQAVQNSQQPTDPKMLHMRGKHVSTVFFIKQFETLDIVPFSVLYIWV